MDMAYNKKVRSIVFKEGELILKKISLVWEKIRVNGYQTTSDHTW
jgi:hypothetical protein